MHNLRRLSIFLGAVVFLCTLFTQNAFSQTLRSICTDCRTDSLLKIYKKPLSDTEKLYALVSIAEQTFGNVFDAKGKIDADSLLSSLQSILVMDSRLKMFNSKPYSKIFSGLQLWKAGYKDSSLDSFKEAINMFDKEKRAMGIYSYLSNIRLFFNESDKLEERLQYYNQKLNYYLENGPVENTATCYNGIAGYYNYKADYNLSISYYMRAADVYKEYSTRAYLEENANIFKNYKTWNNPDKVEYYANLTYPLSLQARDYATAAACKLGLTWTYKQHKEFAKALQSATEALMLSDTCRLLNYKASSMIEMGDIYLEMGRPEKDIELLNEAKKLDDSNHFEIWEFELDYYYYRYYNTLQIFDSAENSLFRAYQKAAIHYSDFFELKYGKELAEFYLRRNEPFKAGIFAMKCYNLGDSLNNAQAPFRIASYEYVVKDEKRMEEIQKLTFQKEAQRRNLLIGLAFILLIGAGAYARFRSVHKSKKILEEKNKIIAEEKHRSDELLLNILPAETAEELKTKGSAKARVYYLVTVMFTDFKNFTQAIESMTAEELVNEINFCYSEFDRILAKYGVEKIKTIGDGYMAAGGLPVENTTNPADTVTAALEIRNFMEAEKQRRQKEGKPFFEIRIGLNTGPVIAGIVGIKKFAYDIWGSTVNIASRMESGGEAGKVNVSGTTHELIKDKFKCTYRGKIHAKNQGEVDMYFVEE